MPRAFLSYSWDSEKHKSWVRELATRLREDGVETTLDQWHVVPGDQLPAFMERAVRDDDYVLIVCTPRYKERSDSRAGGVGYEGDIITGEVLTTRNQRKFIPILREGQWLSSAPSWLSGKCYVDLRGTPYLSQHYNELLTTILGTRPQAPPVGRRKQPTGRSPQVSPPHNQVADLASSPSPDPIRITGLIVDQIGTPKNDGARGSALYAVPFRLSRRPPDTWARFFVEAWDRPSSFTSMHRSGIASVQGDRVILNGTTVEEVDKYHRATLIQAVEKANQQVQELEVRRRTVEQREQDRLDAHKKSVADAADRIKFD